MALTAQVEISCTSEFFQTTSWKKKHNTILTVKPGRHVIVSSSRGGIISLFFISYLQIIFHHHVFILPNWRSGIHLEIHVSSEYSWQSCSFLFFNLELYYYHGTNYIHISFSWKCSSLFFECCIHFSNNKTDAQLLS